MAKLSKLIGKNTRLKKRVPFWSGPHKDGITQSMLQTYLVCKERFRIRVIEGLAAGGFSPSVEYGNFFHCCKEASHKKKDWRLALKNLCKETAQKYPEYQDQVYKWYRVCLTQYEIYLKVWKSHDVGSVSILQEYAFKIPYNLPSGRFVILRGKWDDVSVHKSKLWLGENKTKSDIDVLKIERQLSFDFQTMMYVIAMKFSPTNIHQQLKLPIGGVKYNIIRRPLSGGKGSIRPHQATKNKPAETEDEFYERLSGVIQDNQGDFFLKLKVELTNDDCIKFREQCLEPILENLCDDYEFWEYCYQHNKDPFISELERKDLFPHHLPRHFRFPYGVYNSLIDGNGSEYDYYLLTGNKTGLEVSSLFGELE